MTPVEKTVDLEGEITHMVAFGNTAKAGYDKAALGNRTACSVKVVAGRGFIEAPTVSIFV